MRKPTFCCPFAPLTPPRAHSRKHRTSYHTVNDLIHMFAEKPNRFGLQPRQNKPLSPRSFGKCSPKSNCGPIQTRITSYSNTLASSAPKSAKSEVFRPGCIRTCPRKRSAPVFCLALTYLFLFLLDQFSKVTRSTPVCRHCQGRSPTN